MEIFIFLAGYTTGISLGAILSAKESGEEVPNIYIFSFCFGLIALYFIIINS